MTEAELRAEWRRLVGVALPQAAADRPHWPVSADHCFARIILDNLRRRPWREAIPAPAWRGMDRAQLERGVALARDILDGRADLDALNAASLAWRAKA